MNKITIEKLYYNKIFFKRNHEKLLSLIIIKELFKVEKEFEISLTDKKECNIKNKIGQKNNNLFIKINIFLSRNSS